MTAYQKFKNLPIDPSAIGLEQRDSHVNYYCTPKDARILGWAGVDGPTAVFVGAHAPKLHAACSSLHFEPAEKVQWRAVFSEKRMDDVEVCLI